MDIISWHFISSHVIHILCYMVKCSFSNSILESKIGDSLEARISIMENIQEEFRYDIQEMKVQLVKLTKLIKGQTGNMSRNTCVSQPFPLQPILSPLIHQLHPSHESRIPIKGNVPPSVHYLHPNREPQIPIRGNVPPRVHHPNWQPHAPTPTIILTFGKTSQFVGLANSSRNNLEKPRRNRDKKTIGSYSSHIHRVTSPITSKATCCTIMCAST